MAIGTEEGRNLQAGADKRPNRKKTTHLKYLLR